MFKPRKFEAGLFTGFISVKGEQKTKKGELVFESVVTGKDEFEEDIVETKPVLHKSTFINVVRNYEEGTKPENQDDCESYIAFSSYSTKEKDYVAKDKETKEILAEIDYNEETNKFHLFIKGVEYVSNEVVATDRIVQFNPIDEIPF